MKNNKDKLYNLYVQLEPTIAELEETRKSLISKFKIPNLIIITLIFSVISKIVSSNSFVGAFILWSYAGFIIYFLGFYLDCKTILKDLENYRSNIKTSIIEVIIKQILKQESSYFPEAFIDIFDVQASLLCSAVDGYIDVFGDNPIHESCYDGDDLIKGLVKNYNFQCSELIIGGQGKHNIFKGLFIIINLPKNTNTAFGTSKNISNNKILLDNSEFNELFPVYAENTTEAFYVLPSNLLERMVNFVRKTGRKFDFSVVADKFYIAIPFNRPLLEPPIFKSLFDYSIYEEYLADLELMLGIVEDLKVG